MTANDDRSMPPVFSLKQVFALDPDAGALASFSTHTVPLRQRLDYWHSGVLRRLDISPAADVTTPFRAKLTRLAGMGAEMLDHSGGPQQVLRSAARCRADQRDDISINFSVMASDTHVTLGETRLACRPGDMIILDSSQPAEIKRTKHRSISLFIPRALVHAVCPEPARLAGRLLRPQGIGGILRSHLQAAMDRAPYLSAPQRALAMQVAVQMALAALGGEVAAPDGAAAVLDTGLYHAAKAYIARECTDSELTPLRVAAHLQCSRATLYRVFAAQGEAVSACIWASRVAHARRLLVSPRHLHLQIGEIAFRSGFSDHSNFDRMFKRAYGMKPGDARTARRP
jgi:AraC family transcriptional regulator, positive regulator of tynA and feaB